MAPTAKTLFGFYHGHWEGTTLVVETDYIAAGYFDHEGTPQSDQVMTVERFISNADYSRHDETRVPGGTFSDARTAADR